MLQLQLLENGVEQKAFKKTIKDRIGKFFLTIMAVDGQLEEELRSNKNSPEFKRGIQFASRLLKSAIKSL